MRSFRLASASLVLLGCIGDSPVIVPDAGTRDAAPFDAPGPSDSGTDAAALATLSITPSAPFIRLGQSLDLTVNVSRNGVTGPISLTPSAAPTGTTITVAPIGDGTLSTQMKIVVAANATVGSVPVTLTAPNVADFTFTLVVAGPTGDLDKSFDTDGIVLDTSVPTGSFNAVMAQSDGKIIVAGAAAAPSGAWLVRRYNVDGTPDAGFNTAVAPDLPANGAARAIALDPKNGRIVVVGNVNTGNPQIAILRLNATGKADQGFGSSGLVTTTTVQFGTGSQANAVGVRGDSSVVIAAEMGAPHGMVFRFLEDGTRDMTFDFRTGNANGSGSLSSVAILPQDVTLVTGTSILTNPMAPLAVRLLASGAPDLNFGGGTGQVKYAADASQCSGRSATQTTGGDTVIVGMDQTGSPACEVRIAPSGAFKWKRVSNTGLQGEAGGATAGPNDGTYVVGWYGGSQDKLGYVRRRLATGALDTTFGGTGEVAFEDPNPSLPDSYYFAFKAVTTLSDGRVVAVGQRRLNASPGPVIYRLWP